MPPFGRWLALALATGAAALLIRQIVPVGESVFGFQLGYFASYVVLFAVGVRAGREGWLDRLPPHAQRRATLTGLAALPALPLVLFSADAPRFETGFSAAAVVYAFWEPLVALGAIATLIGWSERRLRFGTLGKMLFSLTSAGRLGSLPSRTREPMHRYVPYALILAAAVLVLIAAVLWSPAWLWLLVILAPLVALGAWDMRQTQHTLLRLYPVSAHVR